MVTVVCLVMEAMLIPLRRIFLAIYNTDPEIITQGETRMLINGSLYFLFGWMQVFVSYLRGLSHGLLPVIISILGICVFRIIWIFTVFPFNPVLEMVYISYPISWILTAAANFICYLIVRKKTYEKMNEEYLARQKQKEFTVDGSQLTA